MYDQAVAVAKYNLKVLEKTNLVGKFWSIKLERPVGFEYTAGQYVSVLVSDKGERRSYSMASWPTLADKIELIFDLKPDGLGSNFLKNLEVGQEAEVLGPMGRFVVANPEQLDSRKFLFVGTGTGMVPLRSMIHDLLESRNFKGLVRLHWGMRSDADLFGVDEWEELKSRFTNFSYDIVMSAPSEKWANCKGHVQDCLVGHGENWSGWEAYLCGSKQMVLDVAALLSIKGVSRENLFFEKFY